MSSVENVIEGIPKVKWNGMALSDDAEILLHEVEVDLDSTRPSMFTLRFAQTSVGEGEVPSFSIGDRIDVLEDSSSTTLLTGEITSVEADYGAGGHRIIVRGYDKSHRLHRERKYRTFLDQKDSMLVSQIAGEVGLAGDATDTGVQHKFIAQVNQTDWEFLSWRADENGMVLFSTDGKLCLKKPGDLPSGPTLSVWTELIAFRPRISAPVVGTVSAKAWDVKTKTAFVGTAPTPSSSDAAQVSDSPDSLANTFGGATHLSGRRSAETQADMSKLAEAVAARFGDSFVDADAVAIGDPSLVPGTLIEIKDAGDQFNGKYRITAAKHVFGGELRYRTAMRFSGMQDRSLLSMTNGAAPVTTRVPRIEGLVPAVVTNNDDPEHQYRVKVKFPWLDDQVVSDWMRCVQFGGGASHGALIVPEVNDEVLVGFEQGDFRRGYVLGGLYNGVDDAHTELGGASLVKSNKIIRRGFSSLLSHRVIFDDDDGTKSGIHLITGDSNLDIYMDQQNKKISIDCKTGKVEIHGMEDITIKSDQNIKMEATQKISLAGKMGVEIKSDTGDCTMAGLNAKLTANVKATVSGNAGLDLTTPAIAQLQGSLVKIN